MKCLMDHIVLNVIDDDAMIAFYTRVLELEPERVTEYRNGKAPFPSVRLNPDTIIDLFPKRLWKDDTDSGKGFRNLNHFCMAMDKNGWDGLRERLNTHGVAIEDGPVSRWGACGTGTSVYFRDPEGTLIEARYYPGNTSGEPGSTPPESA